jgi:putative copper export protein
VGGDLNDAGKRFLEDMKARGEHHTLSLPQRIMRLLLGYLHFMAAIMWFGTIMYVHILLKPAYASQGLPRGELRVGLISMIIVLITGIFLTIARIPSLETFYTTRYGILLAIKIFLFFIMFSSAMIVALFIGPRLRKERQSPVAELFAKNITPQQLAHFDGKDGRPA